jgi:dienelactone hydrolase/lysophospholipase L1-like esterase
VVLLVLALPACAQAAQVLYVGDSLGVGTTPGLARQLGSADRVHGDSRIGRPSSEGLQVLRQTFAPSDDIVVFDLGTNDDPAQPARLAGDLAAARQATGKRCMVVATLNRPPLNGVSVDGLNQAVLAFASAARNVQLVDWNAIASSQPDLLGPDHVHPTPQGYALRAQLFAQAVAGCAAGPADNADSLAPPAPAPKHKARVRHRPRPAIKVPGIESSGISFTEPLAVHGRQAQLLLPNTKPPYPAVVMLGATQTAAEFLAAHGIAALRLSGSAADARAAVELLRRRKEIRPNGIGLWGFGDTSAAEVAAADPHVAAVVALSPAVLSDAEQRDWRARRVSDDPAITTWERVRGGGDDPTAAWRQVKQPVLALWGTRDDQMPIRASAANLKAALTTRDRTFRWFNAGHGGTVVYKDGEPVYAPGLLEESARWLGLHLGARRARPVNSTSLPPANPGPAPKDVSKSSALYRPAIQVLWLALPALLLGIAAIQMRRRDGAAAPGAAAPDRVDGLDRADAADRAAARSSAPLRLMAVAVAACIGCFGLIAYGAVSLLDSPGESVTQFLGMAWPFALALVLAVVLAVCAIAFARRRAWLAAAGALLWVGLALFWLV